MRLQPQLEGLYQLPQMRMLFLQVFKKFIVAQSVARGLALIYFYGEIQAVVGKSVAKSREYSRTILIENFFLLDILHRHTESGRIGRSYGARHAHGLREYSLRAVGAGIFVPDGEQTVECYRVIAQRRFAS